MTTDTQNTQLTDGFHLVIDALKANDLNTIFGLVGIPITDLCRLAQAEGIRFIGFRHEQHAGNAAAIAGYMTQQPGICMTVSAPGFLNGLTALANATVNCFPMILISGSSEREIVDLQQGDTKRWISSMLLSHTAKLHIVLITLKILVSGLLARFVQRFLDVQAVFT
jgi:oxalyl-CoA decarboxylase